MFIGRTGRADQAGSSDRADPGRKTLTRIHSLPLGITLACCLSSMNRSLGQPSNDHCETATAVGDGTFMQSNSGATTDGTASCGFIGIPGDKDVWWQFTAPRTGTTSIDTCGSESGIDTLLNVWSDCDGTELACNDDQPGGGCGSPGFTIHSRVELAVTVDRTYLIRVAEFRGRTGNITLNIVTAGSEPACGDAACNGDEDACTCPEDGCETTCGDACCADDETADECPADCASLTGYADLANCFTGALRAAKPCGDYDLDKDEDVDLLDYRDFHLRRWPEAL